MKAEQFIVDEVTKHLRECARKNKHQAIDAVQEMPTFEGFILPYYVSTPLLRIYNGRNEIPRRC